MEAKLKAVVAGREPPADVEVNYVVFGGVDHRVDKRLRILSDGSVKYATIGDDLAEPPEEEGEYTLKLSEGEVVELLRLFDKNGFLRMEPGGKLEPDSVYSEICLKIGEDEKCVYYYHEEYMQKRYGMEKPQGYRRIEEKLAEIIERAKAHRRASIA